MTKTYKITIESIGFRANVAGAVACVAYYMSPSAEGTASKWANRRLEDYTSECVKMKLLIWDYKTYKPTQIGLDLVETWGSKNFKNHAFKLFSEIDNRYRYVWSAVCNKIGDNFKKTDITDFFLRISDLTGDIYADSTAKGYSGTFLAWAKAAGVCKKIGSGKKTIFTITNYFNYSYELPSEDTIETNTDEFKTIATSDTEDIKNELIKLHILTLDFVSDMANDEDLIEIKQILHDIKEKQVVDELIIDMLTDDIEMALASHDPNVKTLLGKALIRLRKRYLANRKLTISDFI